MFFFSIFFAAHTKASVSKVTDTEEDRMNLEAKIAKLQKRDPVSVTSCTNVFLFVKVKSYQFW